MVHELSHYYNWSRVPQHHKTTKQWLKEHRRLKKGVNPVGTITLVFDKPRARPKGVEAVPPEECQQIRRKLDLFGPDAADQQALYRLDQAGQLATINLYDCQDTEEITFFKEPEAQKLLEYMIWDNSHEDHYITEKTEHGERKRATWKSEFSTPSLKDHLAGNRYYGTKKGRMTMQIAPDCDRHSGSVPGEAHIVKTLRVGEVLKSEFPEYRFAPEINYKNGSVKFFGWQPSYMPTAVAEKLAEKVRRTLQERLPEYNFECLEIFPSNSPQIFAPLRADKITVIGDGVLKKIRRHRLIKINGMRRREYYDAYSCADYLNWVYFSDTPYCAATFEKELREAVARCPDEATGEGVGTKERPASRKRKGIGNGMGSIGRLKGRCATTLVNFWSELELPEDDTLGKYLIVTLRILKYEGLDSDEAGEWVEERLQALRYTAFSDRLTDNYSEIQRVMGYAVQAVWDGNGYQKSPSLSDAKLRASVEAWGKKGFCLHDPATWHNHVQAVVPDYKPVWNTTLHGILPELAALAHCGLDQVKDFLETVLCFVQANSELSESMVGMLLEQCGIKGQSRQKQHDVRKFLVEKGLLVKQRNYFCDKTTGYRHGNFYVCGPAVAFEEEAPAHTHTVSIYLSLGTWTQEETTDDRLDLVMESRCLACERRYRERLMRLRQQISRAA